MWTWGLRQVLDAFVRTGRLLLIENSTRGGIDFYIPVCNRIFGLGALFDSADPTGGAGIFAHLDDLHEAHPLVGMRPCNRQRK